MGSATLDLPVARVGVALVYPKEAHRVFILDILGTIYDVDHLALSTKSVTGANVLDNLLKLAHHRVPNHTRLQFEPCSTPSDLLPSVAGPIMSTAFDCRFSSRRCVLFSEGTVCSNSIQ